MNSSLPSRRHHELAELPDTDGRPSAGKAPSATRQRSAIAPFSLVFAMLFALLTTLLWSENALAQTPRSFRIPPYALPNVESSEAEAATLPESRAALSDLIVDTDPGVDDAIALAWLLSQTEVASILGIVAVAGNTTVENATNNILTVLDEFGNPSIPVVMGAKQPLTEQLSSTGKLIHGKDGLWGRQVQHDISLVEKDAPKFYCTIAEQQPGTTILALGPLTNIARAVRRCGDAMHSYSRIVVLGGAKVGGNTTPVSEFNFWQDPEAAQVVLESGLNIDIVPLDAFTQLTFTAADLPNFAESSMPAMAYLSPALGIYMSVQTGPAGGAALIPDLVAAIYTLEGLTAPSTGLVSALVEVIDRPQVVRGQSIIGISGNERATMIADDKELSAIADEAFAISSDPVFPDFGFVLGKLSEILARVPVNAQVVLDILEEEMRDLFFDSLATYTTAEPVVGGNHIFLPAINGD